MAQAQTQSYARFTQSAAQKYAHSAYFLKLNIVKAVSGMKQKISNWTSIISSHSSNTRTIQDALACNAAECGSSSGFSRLLALQ